MMPVYAWNKVAKVANLGLDRAVKAGEVPVRTTDARPSSWRSRNGSCCRQVARRSPSLCSLSARRRSNRSSAAAVAMAVIGSAFCANTRAAASARCRAPHGRHSALLCAGYATSRSAHCPARRSDRSGRPPRRRRDPPKNSSFHLWIVISLSLRARRRGRIRLSHPYLCCLTTSCMVGVCAG